MVIPKLFEIFLDRFLNKNNKYELYCCSLVVSQMVMKCFIYQKYEFRNLITIVRPNKRNVS